jgi:helix-turn-helix protein
MDLSAAILNLRYTIVYSVFDYLISIILDVKEQRKCLAELGIRLKSLRLARNDTMEVFAQRLGISVGTLRAMEHGTATVQIGAWLRALWVLDHLDDLNGVLAQKESLLQQARTPRSRSRQRASRRA